MDTVKRWAKDPTTTMMALMAGRAYYTGTPTAWAANVAFHALLFADGFAFATKYSCRHPNPLHTRLLSAASYTMILTSVGATIYGVNASTTSILDLDFSAGSIISACLALTIRPHSYIGPTEE